MKPSRNDPCPCGSGRKFKKCCGLGDPAADAAPHALPTAEEIRHVASLMNGADAVAFDAAAADLTRRYPDSAMAWKLLSVARWRQGGDALAELQRAAELAPHDPEAHGNLGNALRRAGRTLEALQAQQRAIELNPRYAEAHNDLGRALQDLGRTEEALASYRRATALRPDMVLAEANLAACLTAAGRLEEGAAAYARVVALDPRAADMHCRLGDLQRLLGHLEPAVRSYRRAVALQPGYVEAHNNLGTTLRDLGRLQEAEESCRAALALQPARGEIHNNLGNVLLELGRVDEAAASYQQALEAKPDDVAALSNLGAVLRDLSQSAAAEACYLRALELCPDRAELHYNLAVVLRLQNRGAEARRRCERALELKPDLIAARVLLGRLHADDGRFADAERCFLEAIALDPDSADAWSGIPALRRMTPADHHWLAAATRLTGAGLAPQKEIHLRYAMGKYCDDTRNYSAAFGHYRIANQLRRAQRPAYDRAARESAVDQVIRLYEERWSRSGAEIQDPSALPVLIVGMPRSGTTLAEQIIAAHPAAAGAGEQGWWGAILAAILAGQSTPDASPPTTAGLATGYVDLLMRLAPGAERVVDKMPGNFMMLGLIHAVLPNARIIHLQRHPVDTCLSIHFQDLEGQHLYAHDLDDLAHYYREYLRIMRYWRAVLPSTTLFEMQYEELVADQETWSRRLIEFIGLPWDVRCLEFHHGERTVITASNWQVRQPVHGGSVQRWRNYETFLGPLAGLVAAVNA